MKTKQAHFEITDDNINKIDPNDQKNVNIL